MEKVAVAEELGFRNVENTVWIKDKVFFYINSLKGLTVCDIAQGVTPVYKAVSPGRR